MNRNISKIHQRFVTIVIAIAWSMNRGIVKIRWWCGFIAITIIPLILILAGDAIDSAIIVFAIWVLVVTCASLYGGYRYLRRQSGYRSLAL